MVRDRNLWAGWTVVLLMLVATVGCRRGDNRQAVSGTVTLDGQLLDDGTINFSAVRGTEGNSSGVGIYKGGQYSIPAAKGLVPGKYGVSVQVWRDTGRTFVMENGEIGHVRAPIRYKEQGKLQVEVVPGSNKFDFNLTSVK